MIPDRIKPLAILTSGNIAVVCFGINSANVTLEPKFQGANVTKKIVTLTGIFIYTLPLFAGSLSVKIENQTIVAKVCNMPKDTAAVNFKTSKGSLTVPAKSFVNGCAIQVLDNQVSGKEISASYLKGTETVPMTATAPVLTESSGSIATQTPPKATGQTAPTTTVPAKNNTSTSTVSTQGSQVVAAAQPVLKTISREKLEEQAEAAANFFANRVVEVYGPVETYRLNFYKGFKTQARLFDLQDVHVQQLPAYGKGASHGNNLGIDDGREAGKKAAEREGDSKGSNEARLRFFKAVGNAAALDVSAPDELNTESYQGLSANKTDTPFAQIVNGYSVGFLAEATNRLNLESQLEFDDDLRAAIYGSRWNLGEYYQWQELQCTMPDIILDSGKAFGLFLKKQFVRENSGNSNMVKDNAAKVSKYREYTDSTQFQDADKNAGWYQSAFMKRYKIAINDKWDKKVCDGQDQDAYIRGEFYFIQARDAYAYSKGEAKAYNTSFRTNSKNAYQETLPGAFRAGFDGTVNTYSTKPVVEVYEVNLVNQSGLPTFAIIDSVNAIVKRASNLGKIDGNIQVQVAGQSILAGQGATKLASLSALAAPVTIGLGSQIGQTITPNSEIEISVSASGMPATTFKALVSWSQTIRQVGIDSPSRKQVLGNYIAQNLGKEMKEAEALIGGHGVDYQKKFDQSLLSQFIAVYKSLPAESMASLDQFKSAITVAMGKKPWTTGKADWEKANAELSKIGWKLP